MIGFRSELVPTAVALVSLLIPTRHSSHPRQKRGCSTHCLGQLSRLRSIAEDNLRNKMPRQIVRLPLREEGPEEAMATLLSWIAYPGIDDSDRRDIFKWSLIRAYIMLRAERDDEFALTPQLIRPIAFFASESFSLRMLNQGRVRAYSHIITGTWFLGPYFEVKGTNRKPRALARKEDGSFEQDAKVASVENMIINLKDALGLEGENTSTFKTKVWKVAKPIAHVGFAVGLTVGTLGKRPFFDLFEDKKAIGGIVRFAEHVRRFVASSNVTFRLSDSEMVCFELD